MRLLIFFLFKVTLKSGKNSNSCIHGKLTQLTVFRPRMSAIVGKGGS